MCDRSRLASITHSHPHRNPITQTSLSILKQQQNAHIQCFSVALNWVIKRPRMPPCSCLLFFPPPSSHNLSDPRLSYKSIHSKTLKTQLKMQSTSSSASSSYSQETYYTTTPQVKGDAHAQSQSSQTKACKLTTSVKKFFTMPAASGPDQTLEARMHRQSPLSGTKHM